MTDDKPIEWEERRVPGFLVVEDSPWQNIAMARNATVKDICAALEPMGLRVVEAWPEGAVSVAVGPEFHNDAVRRRNERIAELEALCDDMTEQRDAYREQVYALEARRERMSNQMSHERGMSADRIAELEAELKTVANQRDSWRASCDSYKAEASEQRRERLQAVRRVAELERQLAEARGAAVIAAEDGDVERLRKHQTWLRDAPCKEGSWQAALSRATILGEGGGGVMAITSPHGSDGTCHRCDRYKARAKRWKELARQLRWRAQYAEGAYEGHADEFGRIAAIFEDSEVEANPDNGITGEWPLADWARDIVDELAATGGQLDGLQEEYAALYRDRDRYKARAEELEKALRGLVDACDRLMGDTDLDYPEDPPQKAMRAALAALDKAGK